MLELLRITNLPAHTSLERQFSQDAFLLKTCQRTLIIENLENAHRISLINAETLFDEAAYQYLLEIICGMQSKLVGESEIVAQFKQAYQQYIGQEKRNNTILLILEKLFKDAKEIRSRYLLGLAQNSYSSIARKHIFNKHKAKKVLILGSGQLAEDLINQFKKKSEVFLSARNNLKAKTLAKGHGIKTLPWKSFDKYGQFAHIVNSIGCHQGSFIGHDFFNQWKKNHQQRLFIDLGSPSVIDTPFDLSDGVMRLHSIFEEGAIHEKHKQRQIDTAKMALKEIVNKRKSCLNQKSKKDEIYARKM